MTTRVFQVSRPGPEDPGVAQAARILREGGLVAIPTETVYGLAANALDAEAVAGIFRAKGRPQDNPLIVHVAAPDWLGRYAREIPDAAYRCMEAFWPGPLTMIHKKRPIIPDVVSAGLDTAGFRCPSHPVASAVIAAAGVPLAAPSANTSGLPSPTLAAHVMADLHGKIDAVVDGGPCAVGVESTVLLLTGRVPSILRPGGVTLEQLEAVLGEVTVDPAVTHMLKKGRRVASPGMKYKHYSPKAHVRIVRGGAEEFAGYVNSLPGQVTALCFEGEQKLLRTPYVTYGRAHDGVSQARRLFDALRHLDEIGAHDVYARCPDEDGVGRAVYTRLLRAAGFEGIDPRSPAG